MLCVIHASYLSGIFRSKKLYLKIVYELLREKTRFLPVRKQRRRSAVQ